MSMCTQWQADCRCWNVAPVPSNAETVIVSYYYFSTLVSTGSEG